MGTIDMNDRTFIRPIRRFVLLLDDQPEMNEGGIVVQRKFGTLHHDFPVMAVGTMEGDVGFGVGDVVVIDDANKGRRVMLDGIVYRLVRVSDVIAVVDG